MDVSCILYITEIKWHFLTMYVQTTEITENKTSDNKSFQFRFSNTHY